MGKEVKVLRGPYSQRGERESAVRILYMYQSRQIDTLVAINMEYITVIICLSVSYAQAYLNSDNCVAFSTEGTKFKVSIVKKC